jgi:WD40 repeat protein
MNGKTAARLLVSPALLILLLASCRGGEAPTMSGTSVGTDTETGMPFPFPTAVMPSTTPSLTETETETATATRNPAGYMLKDWREPVEAITPENMDRVERIGQLKFEDNLERFAFSPEGSWLGVRLLSHGTTIIVDPFTFEKRWEFQHGFGFVAFSYDGRVLETGGIQYDLTTGQQINHGSRISPYPGATMDIEFSPNDQYIVAAGSDHLEIIPMKSGIEMGTFGRYAEPWHASVSPDSQLIAVNYRMENFTELWNPYSRQPVRRLKMKDITGQGKPRFSKDGKSLFFTGNGTWEGQDAVFFQEWDYLSGRPLYVQVIPGKAWEPGLSMDIAPTSGLAALGTMDGNLYLFLFRDCRAILLGAKQPEDTIYDRIDIVAFRPDGKLLATLRGGDKKIEFWGIPESGAVTETPGPAESVTETPVACPNIPMAVEHPTPTADWWGGGRPRK